MAHPTLVYRAVLANKESDDVTSILAFRQTPTRFQAIAWHATKQVWLWAPSTVLAVLNDDEYEDESIEVDRETAERLAGRYLPEPLPSVERLEQMIEEAEKARPTSSRSHASGQAGSTDPDGLSPLQRAMRERVAIVWSRSPEEFGDPLPPLPIPPRTPDWEPPPSDKG